MRTSPTDPGAPSGPRLRWPADPLGGDERPDAARRREVAPVDPGPAPVDRPPAEDLRAEVLELRRAVDALSAVVHDELTSLRQEVAALRRRLPLRAAAADRAPSRRPGPDAG